MQLMAHEDQSTAESVNPKVRQQILERNPLIRAMTDECQAFTIPILGWHLRKNTYFWVTILIFSLPFLYSCVYQMYSPGSPTIVYFDSCRVVNTTNPSYIPIGHVPSFDACADCNGITSSTNAAQITAQANSQLGLRFLLGVGSLLVGVILITMYVELGRFTARSLNLLSYGVYTRVPQPMQSKKIISTLFVCFVFLVILFVCAAYTQRSQLHDVPLAQLADGSSYACIFSYNGRSAQVVLVATFFDNNTSIAAFGVSFNQYTPTDWFKLFATALLLYGPAIWCVYSAYLNPYACIGLDATNADGSLAKIVANTLSINVGLPTLDAAIKEYWLAHKDTLYKDFDLGCFKRFFRRSGSIAKSPPVEYFCAQWGDDVGAVVGVLEKIKELEWRTTA